MKMAKKVCDICGDDVTELGAVAVARCKVCGLVFCYYCIKIHEPECIKKHGVVYVDSINRSQKSLGGVEGKSTVTTSQNS